MPIDSRARVLAREARTQGETTEQLLVRLRGHGCSKGECVVILAEEIGLELDQAAKLVHESSAWQDRREIDEKVSTSMWRSIAEHGRRMPDGTVDMTGLMDTGDPRS